MHQKLLSGNHGGGICHAVYICIRVHLHSVGSQAHHMAGSLPQLTTASCVQGCPALWLKCLHQAPAVVLPILSIAMVCYGMSTQAIRLYDHTYIQADRLQVVWPTRGLANSQTLARHSPLLVIPVQ